MTNETQNNRFQKGSGVFKCSDCGKLTRDTGEGEGETKTCRICLEIWSYENMLENDEITKEEFDKKVKELRGKRLK